jgi:hypothetical protein
MHAPSGSAGSAPQVPHKLPMTGTPNHKAIMRNQAGV